MHPHPPAADRAGGDRTPRLLHLPAALDGHEDQAGPTATLEQLEMHATTLNPGQASHPPHKHPNEELVIIQKGTVEALIQGEWKRHGPGSVIFNASDVMHALRNAGDTPAQYQVVNWTTDKTPKP